MIIKNVGKKIIITFAFVAVSTAVSSVETACDAQSGADRAGSGEVVAGNFSAMTSPAASVEKIEGRWTGQVGTNRIIFTVKPGGEKAAWEYRGQRGCTLEAEDAGTDRDNRKIYVFTSSNGGFCDKLTNGTLYLKKQGNGLSFSLTDRDNRQIESGTLSGK